MQLITRVGRRADGGDRAIASSFNTAKLLRSTAAAIPNWIVAAAAATPMAVATYGGQ